MHSSLLALLLALALAACARAPETDPDADSPAPPATTEPTTPASGSTAEADSTRDDSARDDSARADSTRDDGTRAATADVPPPVLTTFRSGEGGIATLAFRTSEGVPLGDDALVLTVGDETFEMPLQAGPARFTDPDGTVVDQASYTADRAALQAMSGAAHRGIAVSVVLAGDRVAFPYVSGDLIE